MFRSFGFSILLASLLVITVHAVDCNEIVSQKKVDDLISFLKMRAQKSDPESVSQAITRLGDLRAPSGVEVLITFLDFERPQSRRERAGVADMHDKFPAVPALVSIGVPAIPALLETLKGEMNQAARENAIRSVVFSHDDDPPRAIGIFKLASAKARTKEGSLHMESSAREAVKFCSSSWRYRCEAALAAPTETEGPK